MEKLNIQGEPVSLPARKSYEESFSVHGQGQIMGWNACLDEIAKLGPLFTRTDPGEVERLRAELKELRESMAYRSSLVGRLEQERDILRVQLAERDALLERAYRVAPPDLGRDIRAALSASAEPSAAVEIDERAAFEAWAKEQGLSVSRTPQALCFYNGMRRATGDYIDLSSLCSYAAWQARAALERKPPVTPRDAFAAWEPTGNPIRGVNGRLAAKAGFDAGWCAGWTECRADMERKP